MSPEYAVNGLLSLKSDVFSFGVIVLEILSGIRNANSKFSHLDHHYNLVGQVTKTNYTQCIINFRTKLTYILYVV